MPAVEPKTVEAKPLETETEVSPQLGVLVAIGLCWVMAAFERRLHLLLPFVVLVVLARWPMLVLERTEWAGERVVVLPFVLEWAR